MSTASLPIEAQNRPLGPSLQQSVEQSIDELMASLPKNADLSSEQRRGIIARYTAVLEGNFIYWMTAALLAVRTDAARAIVTDNLLEEIRDSHPHMLRKFAIAAKAVPTESDAMAVNHDLANVRLFLGRLSAVRIVVTMAFFEGFIQRFMAYLGDLATLQGSKELEYTDVHGVCDVAHTDGLFRALDAEMALDPSAHSGDQLEGVKLLRTLITTIVEPARTEKAFSQAAAH